MSDDVSFLDLFDPSQPRSSKEQIQARLEICKTCEFFTGKRCKRCGCFMALKTTLHEASCPVGKW
jgi:uncharacterized paraquat-inducible protein A